MGEGKWQVPRAFLKDMKAGNELWLEGYLAEGEKRIYKVPLHGFSAAIEKCLKKMKEQ